MYNKKKILITGGAGYIGSHVTERFLKSKFKIITLDNLSRGYKKLINKSTKFIKADIKNFKKIQKVIHVHKIDTVIHLAGYASVAESMSKKKIYYQNNVIGTLNILKACKNSKVRNFIYSSSCSIYGNVKGKVSENNKPNPKSYYAFTKYESEKLIKKYAKINNFKFIILRYFNVAGASKSGNIGEIGNKNDRLIKNFATQYLKKNPKIKIYGSNYPTKDGTCVRDYIHVSDLADIHYKCFRYLKKYSTSNIFNCGYEKGYSVLEIAKIFKKMKKNLQIIYKKRRIGDVGQVFSSTSKFKKLIGWRPKYNNINKILMSSIKWEKKIKKYK